MNTRPNAVPLLVAALMVAGPALARDAKPSATANAGAFVAPPGGSVPAGPASSSRPAVQPARLWSAPDRVLRAEVKVSAPVAEVWNAWTTDAGIATFLAPEGHVDLRVDGTYDVWFNPEGQPGERGAEGMRILDVAPLERFVFTWNAPPSIASIRAKRNVVVLDFASAGENATLFRLTHVGWGQGPDWDRAFDYFDHAWGAVVLPRLLHRFEKGPIDWKTPPTLTALASLQRTLGEQP